MEDKLLLLAEDERELEGGGDPRWSCIPDGVLNSDFGSYFDILS